MLFFCRTFPEYVLRSPTSGLLNLGDPAARGYIQQFLSLAVEEYGLDVLRIDYNLDPVRLPRQAQDRNRGLPRQAQDGRLSRQARDRNGGLPRQAQD